MPRIPEQLPLFIEVLMSAIAVVVAVSPLIVVEEGLR
jgi:hypothetical protein